MRRVRDRLAAASLVAGLLGVLLWTFVGGWAALVFGSIALVLGCVAVVRINRTGGVGQVAAISGIVLGAFPFAMLGLFVLWDILDPAVVPR